MALGVKERQRIRWDKIQKQQILDQAARIKLRNPAIQNLQLIREAQKVLSVEDQRNLTTVSWQGPFAWFVDGLDAALAKVKAAGIPEREKAAEVPVAAPETIQRPVVTETPILRVEEPPTEEAHAELPPSLLTILTSLVQTLENLKQEKEAPRPVPENSGPVGVMLRLDRLQAQMNQMEERVNGFFTKGVTVTLIPAGVAPVPVAASSPAVLAPPAAPPVPEVKTRKPRVVILNTDSGHVRHGIEKGAQGYVSKLSFTDVSGVKTPEFNEFDYILAYKKTPHAWIEVAKKFYDRNRFHCVSGGAINVVEKIKALPHIEVK